MLYCSTQLVIDDITLQANEDIWERMPSGMLVWSRRLRWQWWQVLRANFEDSDLLHIRVRLLMELGAEKLARAESLAVPYDYKTPPGAHGWRLNRRQAA